jgi:hypothetical protein
MEAKMLFSRFAQPVALLLLVLGFALPAHAQFNKPIRSGDFYEDRASVTTPSGSSLLLEFAQSPTDKFLNVTNVACNIQVASGQAITLMNFGVGTAPGLIDLGRPYALKGSVTPETVGTAKFYSIVTNQVFYKMGPGRYPSIVFASVSTGSFSYTIDCVIVGNLTDG